VLGIIQEHLIAGRVVAEFVFARNPLAPPGDRSGRGSGTSYWPRRADNLFDKSGDGVILAAFQGKHGRLILHTGGQRQVLSSSGRERPGPGGGL
jgi:hypothetical protein